MLHVTCVKFKFVICHISNFKSHVQLKMSNVKCQMSCGVDGVRRVSRPSPLAKEPLQRLFGFGRGAATNCSTHKIQTLGDQDSPGDIDIGSICGDDQLGAGWARDRVVTRCEAILSFRFQVADNACCIASCVSVCQLVLLHRL